MKCETNCGNNIQVIHIEIPEGHTYKLCKNCECAFVNLALSKKQFFGLLREGHTTAEHMLHSDFYTESGLALQPWRD